MFGQVPPHRAIAIAIVLALHLLIVLFLLNATFVTMGPPPMLREAPITLWLAPAKKPKPPKPQEKKKKKQGVAQTRHRAALPLTPPVGAPPPSNYNGLRALGRYMNNCSAGNYEALSTRELAHCLGDVWEMPGRSQAELRMPQEPDSIWKRQKQKQSAPIRPMEHQCPLGSKNDQLGLPCFFGQ